MSCPVSVVIPTYGRRASLQRAIDSVRTQPGAEPEIVIVDDGTPGGLDLDPLPEGVRIVRNERNAGPGAARNLGAAHASHDVIAFLDSDDEWLPSSLRPRLARLAPNSCVVGPYWRVYDRLGTETYRFLPENLEVALKTRNPIPADTVVMHRNDFEKAGGFPEDRDCAEGWVFFLRVVAAGIRLVATPDAVLTVHVDGANTPDATEMRVRHALGAVRHIETEKLLPSREVARARRLVSARAAGFYANAGMIRPALVHAGNALVGSIDGSVSGTLLCVPVLALRGALRRRRDASLRPSMQSVRLDREWRSAIVLARSPSEAWLVRAVEGVRQALPQARLALIEGDGSASPGLIARWRVVRSGEPDARLRCSLADAGAITADPEDLSALVRSAELVIDLTGSDTYHPERPDDPPVVRPAFGPDGDTTPERGFESAFLSGRQLDRIDVVLESEVSRVRVRSAPAVIDPDSVAITANGARWKAAATIPRTFRYERDSYSGTQSLTGSPALPAGARLVAHAARVGRYASSLAAKSVMRQRWGVAIQPTTAEIPATDTIASAPSFWVEDDCALADPHLVDMPDGTYLFVERIRPGKPAVIAASRIDEDGRAGRLRDVLALAHHVSYPGVFVDEDVPWMIPEMSAARRVQLFRADEFPHRWTASEVLLEGISAFDPTIHRDDRGYWLWACVAPFGRGRNDELWLFHSPSLRGPWRAHPENPVIDDPRLARPAGALFVAEGRLIRPAQDCSQGYGRRIVLNEVLEMTTQGYRERPIATIEPSWSAGLIGTHTIARARQWQALDGACSVVDPVSPRHGVHL